MGFALDAFQLRALNALDHGRSVLVAAPTGSGKTVVAEYAVALALDQGGKVFYTTPLKALSNQKYADLRRYHGPDRVGLLTGDNVVNGAADAVVMTTEVLRNMIYARSSALERLRYVILDEVHYLQNPYRGSVWEEVIIHTPPTVDLVCLSATVSNAEEVAEWIQAVRGDTVAVIEDQRPVQLRHFYMVGSRPGDGTAVGSRPGGGAGSAKGALRLLPVPQRSQESGATGRRLRRPRRTEVVSRLDQEAMLPAIYFIFSRAGCDEAVRQCLRDGVRLTSAVEAEKVRAMAESKVSGLSPADRRVLGYQTWLSGLEAGLAAHHAGLVPAFRKAVEACFGAALVKVVFATETLSLGINMPARTVVIETLSKFTGESHEDLTPGEYAQLTGRAGRRGIDEVGNAVVLWSPLVSLAQVAALASSRTYELVSSFRCTYNMVVNLVRRHRPEEAHHLLNRSFAQFRVDADVVRLEGQLDTLRGLEAEARQRPAAVPRPGGGPGAGSKRAERLGRQANRLERQIKAREGTLGRQFQRVSKLLQTWGYLDGWALTPAGQRLCRLYHELDLLVAQTLDEGVLDGLGPAELAGMVSVFTFEARGSAPAIAAFPDAAAYRRWSAILAIGQRLARAEAKAGLPPSRAPDPGFMALAQAWAGGQTLESVLGEGAMSGGDFVRNAKQLVDLLGQIGQIAPQPATAASARRAADAVLRGVVVSSSVVGGDGGGRPLGAPGADGHPPGPPVAVVL